MAAAKHAASKSNFSDAEKAAMKERAKELKAEARAGDKRAKGEEALLAAIGEMPADDRKLATKIHEIATATAPKLFPKTWYGMPAYADADGKTVFFFKAASKFDARYAELGFNDSAALDDGAMWPTVYALTTLTSAVEQQIRTLVQRAVG